MRLSQLISCLLLCAWPQFADDLPKVTLIASTTADYGEGEQGIPMDLSNQTKLEFASKQGTLVVPYAKIASVMYGQKAQYRVGTSTAATVLTLGAAAPFFIGNKKRAHVLTVGFTDADGKPQAVVLLVPKDWIKVTMLTLRHRSGVKVEYESADAREHIFN